MRYDGQRARFYTIEYVVKDEDGGERRADLPMIFGDKETTLENAVALVRSGIIVSRVKGPRFEMGRSALSAYARHNAALE